MFFIEHGTRHVHLAGITGRPTGEWVTQQARNLLINLDDHADGLKFLVRDRDTDRMLITSGRHLRLVLSEYVEHYSVHRPHRTLCQSPPAGRERPPIMDPNVRVLRRDRLGGLLCEYAQVALGDRIFGTHRATATYVRATTHEVATALVALTGEPHPLATQVGC